MPAVAGAPPAKKREKAKAEFIGERAQGKAYALAQPLRVDGVEYHETRISSPVGSKFGAFKSMRDEGVDDEDLIVWLVCDLPIDVVENLAFEDKMELTEQGLPFLPRRMREAMTAVAEAVATAEPTTT